jgi:leader peptidase (prepilin peptidase)/N-methyltransferase
MEGAGWGAPVWVFAAAAILGLMAGSTLNVVVHRLPRMLESQWQRDAALLRDEPAPEPGRFNLFVPGSHCPVCHHRLRALELVPLVSWLALKARCSACKAPISLRYPLVEAACAGLFMLCVARFGTGPAAGAAMIFCAIVLAAAVIDLETQLLPDALTLPLVWAGLLAALAGLAPVSLPQAVAGAAAGYLSLWLIHHAFRLAAGREGMGYGDFKLFAALGAWLGWAELPMVLLLAAASAAVVTVAAGLARRRDVRQPIAFGPWLAGAGLIALFAGPLSPVLLP